jgi:cyclopropane-fatty-acyl-phospholipid synthase
MASATNRSLVRSALDRLQPFDPLSSRTGMRAALAEAFSWADIRLDGKRPWDITVHDDRFYPLVFSRLTMGLGESYMAGWWDCEDLLGFVERSNRADLSNRKVTWALRYYYLQAKLLNMQSSTRAFQVGEVHYDKGNDLYEAMLGPRMVYSGCLFSEGVETLAEAEETKLDLICRKIGLCEGQRVLDIGCGWASFAQYAAEKYGALVTGVTVSKQQAEYARTRCEGLPVTIDLLDYREVTGTYDHVVCIGMLGHVGPKNYRTLFEVVHRCLSDNGLFLFHTLGSSITEIAADPWVDRYIFPNGVAPSMRQLSEAIEGLFSMEDWHNFSTDYGRTTMAWFDNFHANWERLAASYDTRFYRMWKYYLHVFGGAFLARTLETWDVVLSKQGTRSKYISIR